MFSNETKNLKLPQYSGSDKANWDIDTNYAYQQIDDFSEKVQENKNDTDTRIDNNTGRIEALENRCTTIEDTNVSQSEKITENENDIIALQTLTEKHSRDIVSLNNASENHEEAIDTAGQKISQLEGNLNLTIENLNTTAEKTDLSLKISNPLLAGVKKYNLFSPAIDKPYPQTIHPGCFVAEDSFLFGFTSYQLGITNSQGSNLNNFEATIKWSNYGSDVIETGVLRFNNGTLSKSSGFLPYPVANNIGILAEELVLSGNSTFTINKSGHFMMGFILPDNFTFDISNTVNNSALEILSFLFNNAMKRPLIQSVTISK